MGTPSAGVPSATARASGVGSRAATRVRLRSVRRARLRFALATVSGFALVLLFAAVAERIAYSGKVLPGVEITGTSVHGKTEADALGSIRALATRLDHQPIRARAGTSTLVADSSNLRLRVDAVATVRAARRAGRSHNPLEQIAGTVLRRFRPDRVPLRVTYDSHALEGILDGWAQRVDRGVVEGGLRFEGTKVVPIEPHSGTGIVRDKARARLVARLHDGDRSVLSLPTGRVDSGVDAAGVQRAAAAARRVLSQDVVLTGGGSTMRLTAAQVASTLSAVVDHHRLALYVDPKSLQTALGAQLSKAGVLPVAATFEVTAAGAVNVVPSRTGRSIDLNVVGRAIANGQHAIVAPVKRIAPAHNTAWARSLGIKELVSTFTTYHQAGQARVQNIHRAADLINNLVVEPGHVFSLDGSLGPRTPERGFVKAPVFYGEFVEDYGGGVSQLATTFFNAVFFGGYQDVAHQPHSIYISRYPMGRESTINYGTIDVKFRNNSRHGVLIRTSYNDTSITVSFYGDKEGKVVQAIGPHILAQQPITDQLIKWPFLPAGERKQIESGYTGYDVENFRVIEQPGKAPVRERFFWHYDMIPNKVLVGTKKPPPPTTAPGTKKPPKRPKPATTTSTTKPA
ncbi:MAG: putative vancomycin resistance protein [Actinomycetia bacterium]|nr:putative vancomycin resistance protein [Actinomycetes bacterium]